MNSIEIVRQTRHRTKTKTSELDIVVRFGVRKGGYPAFVGTYEYSKELYQWWKRYIEKQEA